MLANVEAARAGDPEALEALLRERRTEVVRYAMRLCISPADAEDATQEALLALAHYIRGLREVAALSRWLFLAVRTHCTRLARRSLRHVLALDGDTPLTLEGPTAEDQLVDHQLRHRLAAIVADLEPSFRDVLLRRDVLGEPAHQAAAALGITVEALKSRLHRARAEVKQRLLASLEPPARRSPRPARRRSPKAAAAAPNAAGASPPLASASPKAAGASSPATGASPPAAARGSLIS